MEASTKIILLMAIYALPVCLAIIIRINKNKKIKRKMITENEVPDFLGEELPEINYELEKLSNMNDIYKTMQCFVDFTKDLAGKRNLAAVKNCFNLAEKMLNEGNNTVKNAVENVFVFSVSSLIEMVSPIQEQIKLILPKNLKNVYRKQIMANYP